jgi:hypothetical protein
MIYLFKSEVNLPLPKYYGEREVIEVLIIESRAFQEDGK